MISLFLKTTSSPVVHFPAATHEIKELANASIGETVTLHGYLGPRADLSKKLSFVPLISKDLSHSVQVISTPRSSEELHTRLKALGAQDPVAITGILKERKPTKSDGGEIQKITNVEVELKALCVLNEFPKEITFQEDTNIPPEQRHLQLRQDKGIRDALAFRSKAANICRDELSNKHQFLEIETPLLFKSTPEGAREFLVPTRTKGLAYALPQSPQQYKQILMASGIPKYFQIARCFRDEDLRADRQPEFTQLDLEMSFAAGEDVQKCIEDLVRRLWGELLDVKLPSEFPRMSYNDAMAKYGSDKPDIRLGMEISQINYLLPVDLISKIGPLTDPAVDVMRFRISDDPSETRKFVNEFMDSPDAAPFINNPDGQPGIFIFDTRKPLQGLQPFGFEAAERLDDMYQLEDGDLIIIQARKNEPFSGGSTPIGNLRLALHKAAVAKGLVPAPQGFEFLWIVDFPLFSPSSDTEPGQGGAAGLSATHHPFTAPKTAEDVSLLSTDPASVRAEHYDIVVNGVELGGGSRRIHDARVQEFIMRDVLKMKEERLQDFRHLLDVLRAGCPPHAGIALGFDRLIAVMLGKESVRDVIAFPKSGKGEDLLVKAPNAVTKEQLETYHLMLKN
ncbi:Aspartyl/Asparaginyl-tRNA synthetase class IIb [Lasiodiplodia theobromae]|uniref:Aspartate--tRNA(Asp/Asn) ligase n=1 Tax=Lasiodiplodia theobromae TaxID=45133 RepID=A0A5N5CYZ1_9PEZI|nr:Aspartyl/Asparaginyl-tRNA synthetase class IIb [Lasiodiplodia theobromae]KAB2570573.1 Aspartate--tRNA(Asp/Asn) ligase [Lasiodiplodia theobromae]KAF4541737.1 Aspartyl/Asparaginyl-tRNA synthetase class IIb [Lasiodiplodia theobromae]